MGTKPYFRYVTASLQVDYLQPTPIGETLVVRATVSSFKGRKAVVNSILYVRDVACARGEVIVVEMPQHWLSDLD
jgi:acyl-CoA thioesterase FadM